MRKLLFLLLIVLLGCSKDSESEKKSDQKHTNFFYEKAFVFVDKEESNSAFLYFNKAKEAFLKQKDSFGVAKCYVNMAIIQEKEGDNFGSIESSLFASKLLNEKDNSHHGFLFSNYNNLGITSYNLKNYSDAERF